MTLSTFRLQTVLIAVALLASVASLVRARWVLENRSCLRERAAFHASEESSARKRLEDTRRALAELRKHEKKPEAVSAEIDAMLSQFLNDPVAYGNLLKWMGVPAGSNEATRQQIIKTWTNDIVTRFDARVSELEQREAHEGRLADYHHSQKLKYEAALKSPWQSVDAE